MPLDPDNLTEPTNGYTLCGLSQHDVIMLGAGLATPLVRSMALLALSGPTELALNAEKPRCRKRKATA